VNEVGGRRDEVGTSVREVTAEIDGTRVVMLDAPPTTAVPVLYLHGVPTSADDWTPFLARTGGIAPDLPGFGRSDKSAAFDYSIPGYARFLRAFVDELGLERFSLVMHDWGVVGLALAQEAPDLVERLVVMDAVPFLPGYRWHTIARIWRTPLLGELFMGSSTRWAARLVGRRMRVVPEEQLDTWVEEGMRYFDHGTQRAILRLYRSAPSDVLARAGDRLGELTADALVVWGERDGFLPTSFAHAYGDALGGDALVEVVERAGHWPWLDRPELVDRIAGFLGG
jgi:pimeloyl-ACP methyl ester carboxylesterase